MLSQKLMWLKLSERIEDELKQCIYEGRNVKALEGWARAVLAMPEGEEKEAQSKRVLLALESAPFVDGNDLIEPERYEEIVKTLPDNAKVCYDYSREGYEERLKGAWYGRAIGCLLGIPVEGWHREKIHDFLEASGQLPLSGYMRSDVGTPVRKQFNISDEDFGQSYDRTKICWKNNVSSFPVDDDTNYTVCALRLLENYGRNFTCQEAAQNWLMSFPVLHACTAERVALQNILNGILPPDSGKYLNPYREWIGAQIRGDFFGYIHPGRPMDAAKMAWEEGRVSHVKNGIYGEMYIAALLSLAGAWLPASDWKDWNMAGCWLCENALLQIPPKSRLAADISRIIALYKTEASFESAVEFIHGEYNEKNGFDWCYVNPNAMIVTACILWFARDFSMGVIKAVESGFDTDCNGATVGSVLGMLGGFSVIAPKWLEGLEQVLTTSIHKYEKVSLEDAVKRTMKLLEQDCKSL
ncbi:MAG: ADP-ribosylglycohydrolase family protein [Clostridiales bacterium]|nr:ADP-ribosylglycohydrolase family protein [Clostridiales bacterium]